MLKMLFLIMMSLTFSNSDVLGHLEYENYVLEYGNRDRDAFIQIFDVSTEEKSYIWFNQADMDNVEYVAIINQDIFIAVYQSYDISEVKEPGEIVMTMVSYTFKGREIKRTVLDEKPIAYGNHNGYLILQYSNYNLFVGEDLKQNLDLNIATEYVGAYKTFYQGLAYVDGMMVMNLDMKEPGYYLIEIIDQNYCFSIEITVIPDIEIQGEYKDGYYLGEVKIDSETDLYLNNELYEQDQIIDVPGNYQLIVYGNRGFTYETAFIIYPVITYFDGSQSGVFIENMEFHSPVRLFSNAISLSLDGDSYDFDMIDDIGTHIITVYGVNQMRFDIPFKVMPSYQMERVSDHEVMITVFGEGRLNNMPVSEETRVTIPGEYVFELVLENEVLETVYFQIEGEVELDVEEGMSRSVLSYVFIGLMIIGAYIILRKK